MAFCNAVGKVSHWNAVGVPLANMLLLLWWTMHFVLWEQDGMSHLCWQISKICIVFMYGFQNIPFKWMHHTYCDIVWHLNINSVPIHPAVVYPIFFAKGSYFNLNAKPANPKLALHHNLTDLPPTCINSSHQHLISLPACPASKQELLSSWKKRGAMAVTSGLLGLNNTWRTTIIVGQWLAHVGTQLLVLLHLYRYSRMPLIHAANMAASFVG
jgi:hypothetical protein